MKPRHTDIPTLVYDMLRAVHESRAKRADSDADVPHLTNAAIFLLMPDCAAINWARGEQSSLIAATLAFMAETVVAS